ncbi:MAG: 50S ribosomal protein L11 methyltransferase [Bacteroidales bacterium]|nr:50S ribosomal protein L11 methyltransferase [Bacteroidales bacterium]MDD3701893.1 50S ribosomal protein L11 methyltransferase [Bacteroidales bacterium]MDY0369629.1 50S ribosomal protein L11 methyltransferase [Bacteroidales bacterium]
MELTLKINADTSVSDLMISELLKLGYDSFMEEEPDILKAYISTEQFQIDHIHRLLSNDLYRMVSFVQAEPLPDQNWNASWEASYEAVVINDRCRIRAPFHAKDPSFEFDLLIEPKMSFGTAHHETTAQMLQLLFDIPLAGKKILDMGCGTAVLAILARKLGASEVVAIDNDPWAYRNASENILLNEEPDIIVEEGDAALLKGRVFDVIIANINRQILLHDMGSYATALTEKGYLLLSGFYTEDLEMIQQKAAHYNLKYVRHESKNNWVAAMFVK